MTYALYHTKHYQDNLSRCENKEYRFYDEREWRYIPEFQCAVCELKKTELEYSTWRAQSESKPLLEEVQLEYNYSDIEHIIVEKKEHIQEIVEFIKNINEEKLNGYQRELLYTKIICFENIEKDI